MSKKSRKLLEKFEDAISDLLEGINNNDPEVKKQVERQYKLAKANLAAHLIVLEEMAKGSF